MDWPASTASDAYEAMVLEAIRGGNFTVRWGTVHSEIAGHRAEFRVFADALMIDGVRINCTARLQQQIADLLGCSLLTPRLLDLMWLQCDVALLPLPMPITASSAAMVEQSKRIDDAIAKAGGVQSPNAIVQTVGKTWVLDKPHGATAINYGWQFPGSAFGGARWELCVTGKCRLIQGEGWAHGINHSDYSQNCLLVSRECIVDGVAMDLRKLLASRELAPLASESGALSVFRQPGVAELAPSLRARAIIDTSIAVPMLVAGGAIAVGFVVGLLARRRKKNGRRSRD